MIISKDDKDSQKIVTDALKNGKIVILPTDTVYGFSGIVKTTLQTCANNFTPTDVRIRAIKGRSETKPLIQLIGRPEDIKLYTNDEIPQTLLSNWPGPLTIIVHIKDDAPLAPEAKLPTIAFRCPGDEWLRKIILQCGSPIYSTSVNRSGKPVLDTEAAIDSEFSAETDLIVHDGDKKGALPSTLVTIDETGAIKVLRQGSVKL